MINLKNSLDDFIKLTQTHKSQEVMMTDRINELKTSFIEECNPEKKANIAKTLADDLWHIGQLDDSRHFAEQAIQIAETHNFPEITYLSYTTIGITHSIQGKQAVAREYFEKALDIAKSSQISGAVLKCLVNLGICEHGSGNHEKALDYYYESLKLPEIENDIATKSKLYNNIGIVLTDLKEYSDALYYLKIALKLQININDLTDIGNCMINIGNIYQLQNDLALASGYYKRAIRIYESQNHVNLIFIYHNMASILEKKKQISKAIDYYHKVIELSVAQDNNTALFQSYQSVFMAYISIQDRYNAQKFYQLSKELESEISDKNLLFTYYHNCAHYLKFIEDYKSALDAYRMYIETKDELSDAYFNDRVAELKTRFDYEHKKQEAELYRQRSIQLSQYNQQIDQQKEELIYLNKSKDSILNIVSHDLKNSIGSISSLIEIITVKKKDHHLDKYYNMINESAHKALDLVKDILDVSRFEMQDYKLSLEPYNLFELIESYRENMQSYADLKDIHIKFYHQYHEYPVLLNERKFWQIIYNLVTNAIKFTHRNGAIHISTQTEKQNNAPWVKICIQDNGIGIDKETIPLLFDKFSIASRKGTEGESTTGLGLSIVKKLTELQKGKISVRSETGKGTEFILMFPLVKE